jgi:hypothetical protein
MHPGGVKKIENANVTAKTATLPIPILLLLPVIFPFEMHTGNTKSHITCVKTHHHHLTHKFRHVQEEEGACFAHGRIIRGCAIRPVRRQEITQQLACSP